MIYGKISMKTSTMARLAAGGILVAVAGLSYAQYMWIDEKGLKQFSDRPPPPNIPIDKILKSPAPVKPVFSQLPGADAATAATAASQPAAKGPPTLAEREADYKKRQKEQAEADAKAREEAQRRADIAANCESARESKAQLESGARIGYTDRNGNQGLMDDQRRAQEAQKAERVLAGCR
jgi:type IV secretory pathway VirB10-like protein